MMLLSETQFSLSQSLILLLAEICSIRLLVRFIQPPDAKFCLFPLRRLFRRRAADIKNKIKIPFSQKIFCEFLKDRRIPPQSCATAAETLNQQQIKEPGGAPVEVQQPEVHRSGRLISHGCPVGARQTVDPNWVVQLKPAVQVADVQLAPNPTTPL